MTTTQRNTSTRRVLITGAGGQDGRYLADQLAAQGATVFGLVRTQDSAPSSGVTPLRGDLGDAGSLAAAIDRAEPDEIYNLAAATFVPDSWEQPGMFRDINELGVARLLAAIRATGAPIRLCQASTAEIFGTHVFGALDENTPLRPSSPYGVSKAQAHRLVQEYREQHGLFACSAILFNHESALRPPHFVTRKITLAAARISRGLQDKLTLGSLDAWRDWGYAPEYVGAMTKMLAAPVAADYVVATGCAHTVGEFAELAFSRVGLNWRDHVISDPALTRPDGGVRTGNPSKIERELGWKAQTTLAQLVGLMVDADLAACAQA